LEYSDIKPPQDSKTVQVVNMGQLRSVFQCHSCQAV
jgi:hypothetical protein